MNTPNGQQEPYGTDPTQPGQQPPQPQGRQDTRAPEDDIPRPREDQHGSYNAYPAGEQYAGAGQYGEGGYYRGGGGQLSYLNGGPVGFVDAIRGAIGNIFTLRGRASRSAFWWFALLQVIAYLVVSWISDRSTVAGVILDILIGLPLLIAGISLAVRRLHDSNRTGWWWWIGFIPFIGGIILLVFYLLPGTPGPNRYNTSP
jgi:uncharacterized membrane protein YhaH (DUF805 family)